MNILGIETSCDDTGVAIYNDTRGLIAAQLYSQTAVHAPHGGVVPELASRDHVTRLVPLIEQTLQEAGLTLASIGAIAYTAGPGLLGALLVGAGVAKSLAFALNIPAIAVHHMEGHLLAPLLETPAPDYPFLALLVSGGHTQWVAVQSFGQYELLGESVDDAVGEAFDKTAKLLGLPYPGGAALSMLAREGDPRRFAFPRPMTDRPGLDMSFSGLKTAVLHTVQQHTLTDALRADIAASFQQAVIDTLMIKGRRAIAQTGLTRLVVAGGVSANVPLRAALRTLPVDVYFPRHEFCTDNGAMIAYAGYCRWQRGERDTSFAIAPNARWALMDIHKTEY